MIINTNISSMRTANHLRRDSEELEAAMERLRTGRRINEASHDAVVSAITSRMDAALPKRERENRTFFLNAKGNPAEKRARIAEAYKAIETAYPTAAFEPSWKELALGESFEKVAVTLNSPDEPNEFASFVAGLNGVSLAKEGEEAEQGAKRRIRS